LAEVWLQPTFFTASRGEMPIIWVTPQGQLDGSAFHTWTRHGLSWLRGLESEMGFEVQMRLFHPDEANARFRFWPDEAAALISSGAPDAGGKTSNDSLDDRVSPPVAKGLKSIRAGS
jgi:hypothetical protein